MLIICTFVLLFVRSFCSELTLEHKSLLLLTTNRVCGLRAFSQKPVTTKEEVETLLGDYKLIFFRNEAYIGVSYKFSEKYVKANYHTDGSNNEAIFYQSIAAKGWFSKSRTDIIHSNVRGERQWIKIATDMADCAEFDANVKLGSQNHKPEFINELQITDELADAQINFKDAYGEKSRNYPVSKYALASKSPYFKSMFTNGMRESLQGKDEPITIQCHKLNEKVQQDFLACVHQNKFTGQKDNECMSNHLKTMEIGHLVDLLVLATQCQVTQLKQTGESVLMKRVETIKDESEFDQIIEYAKVYEDKPYKMLLSSLEKLNKK